MSPSGATEQQGEKLLTDISHTHAEPQRLRALEHANAIRLARAELKRRIAIGEVSAAEIIVGCPVAAQRWTVAELLMSQRRWGVTRCRKFLERNNISEIKPIGSLTERQRALLASQLASVERHGDGVHADFRDARFVSAPLAAPVRALAIA
jgi:hypothetical protein